MIRYRSTRLIEPPPPAGRTHTHLVHLFLVNQLWGIHKVLAIKQDDSGCDCTGTPPEHHISQSLCPGIPWKTNSIYSSSSFLIGKVYFACSSTAEVIPFYFLISSEKQTAMFTWSITYQPEEEKQCTWRMQPAWRWEASDTQQNRKQKVSPYIRSLPFIVGTRWKTWRHSQLGTSSPSSHEEEWAHLTPLQQSCPGKGR